jgi:hypothetical protein
MVRTIPGVQGRKNYRCPGCDHEIAPGVGHLVVWPAGVEAEADGTTGSTGSEMSTEYDDADQRRHWHTTCWAARHRRRPGRRAAR